MLLMRLPLLLSLFVVLVHASLAAQCTITFSYDAGGNRIARGANCPPMIVASEPMGTLGGEVHLASNEDESSFDLTKVSVFPNPASSSFQLQFTGKLPSDGQLVLLDATGRQVMRQAMTDRPYPVDQLPVGTYRLLLRTLDQQYSVSLIKTDQ